MRAILAGVAGGEAITVTVRLGGRLRAGQRRLRLAAPATVADALAALASDPDLGRAGIAAAAVSVAGEIVPAQRPLADGDALALILPVAGGA